jgi:hypothetical protein
VIAKRLAESAEMHPEAIDLYCDVFGGPDRVEALLGLSPGTLESTIAGKTTLEAAAARLLALLVIGRASGDSSSEGALQKIDSAQKLADVVEVDF